MGSLANPATPFQAFSSSDVPLVPPQLRAGDSWNWTMEFASYTSVLYKLALIFNSASNRFALPSGAISQDGDSESFDIQATSAQTGACPADTYDLIAVLTGVAETSADGQQVTIPLQSVIVQANIAGAAVPVDTRSFVKKTLDMIEAAILGNTDPSVQEYMVNGRQLRRISPLDLSKLRAVYRNLYKSELRAAGVYAPTRKIGFRFNRAF